MILLNLKVKFPLETNFFLNKANENLEAEKLK